MKDVKIGFIGGGNMATALIGGLVKQVAPQNIHVVEIHAEAREKLTQQFGVKTQATLDVGLQQMDVIVLAVKPQGLREVVEQLQPHLGNTLLISIAAGIRAQDISRWLGGYGRIIRTMPNTPALIGLGVTGLAALPGVNASDQALATTILQAVGQTVWLQDESQLDAVTAISGSGPAYVFYFIEAMQAAAQQMGLDHEQAKSLVLGTFVGAAQLAAQSPEPASVLRERVTSKGGTTAAALDSLNQAAVQSKIMAALEAARLRAIELGDQLGQ
jgi:pyrroline-5-carboxylate reductase